MNNLRDKGAVVADATYVILGATGNSGSIIADTLLASPLFRIHDYTSRTSALPITPFMDSFRVVDEPEVDAQLSQHKGVYRY